MNIKVNISGRVLKGALTVLLSAVLLAGCKDNPLMKPSATGRPYEVLVVMDEEMQKGPIGCALDSVLTSEIVGLPMSESFAALSHVTKGDFTGSLKFFRNIVYVDINPSIYTRTSVHFTRDENANGQYIISINSPNGKEFIDYCAEKGEELKGLIARGELKRYVAFLQKKHSQPVAQMAKKMFDCELKVPVDISRTREGENFMWAATPTSQMNIVVYSYPYAGPETFTRDYVLAMRDSVLGEYIKGANGEHDHMATNKEMTEVTPINVKGNYCMEARGLWEMTVSFLGGPFVSHSRVDTVSGRVIVAEGFVMEFEKLNRTMMRNLEAALWTLNTAAPAGAEAKEEEVEDAGVAEGTE